MTGSAKQSIVHQKRTDRFVATLFATTANPDMKFRSRGALRPSYAKETFAP
jgi:hypothetical protein